MPVSFYSSVTADLPPVNYATTLDYYVFVSFILAFFSLVEVAMVHHFIKRQGNHILATELDFFCRRTVLPFWGLFNIAMLVQLPPGSFPWLWVVCGTLMGVLLLTNLWLMLYYVWKRYQVRIELEASAFSGDLKQFAEFVDGKFDIGAEGSLKRKFHDYVLRSTDTAFKALHLSIPGAKILKEIEVDVDGDGILDKVLVANTGTSERDRIDRKSLEGDVVKAREAAVDFRRASMLLQPDGTLLYNKGLGPRKGRPVSLVSVQSVASVSDGTPQPPAPQLTLQSATMKRTALD